MLHDFLSFAVKRQLLHQIAQATQSGKGVGLLVNGFADGDKMAEQLAEFEIAWRAGASAP